MEGVPIMVKILPYLIVLAIFAGSNTFSYFKGRSDMADEIALENAEKTLTDQEALNEIRNNRPDDAALIDSLLSGEF